MVQFNKQGEATVITSKKGFLISFLKNILETGMPECYHKDSIAKQLPVFKLASHCQRIASKIIKVQALEFDEIGKHPEK